MRLGQSGGTANIGRRDAFHVPAVFAASAEKLEPGQSVRFIDDAFSVVAACRLDSAKYPRHGIVDPFLASAGKTFWVLLEPSLVGGELTHNFSLVVTDVGPAPAEPVDEYGSPLSRDMQRHQDMPGEIISPHEIECRQEGCW